LRAAEAGLRTSLEEKTLLLQELYHRLHNTLQVVQSLVAQAGRRFDEPRIREAFDAVVDRIHSIAMLQEQFYRSGNLSSLAFAPYLEALAGNVLGGAADRVAVRLDLDPVQLPVGKAVPMALIANELLMNAFKHAFPEGRRGAVSVSLERDGDRAVLTVSDDGVGRGEAREAKGSGLGIAGRLARQVGAEIAFPPTTQGTTAVVAFRPDA
jgi:two-component sensor histidine kinase